MSRGVRKIPQNLRFPLIDPGAAFCPGAAWGARAGKERIQIRGAALQLIIRRVRRRLPGIHKHTAAALFCLPQNGLSPLIKGQHAHVGGVCRSDSSLMPRYAHSSSRCSRVRG